MLLCDDGAVKIGDFGQARLDDFRSTTFVFMCIINQYLRIPFEIFMLEDCLGLNAITT